MKKVEGGKKLSSSNLVGARIELGHGVGACVEARPNPEAIIPSLSSVRTLVDHEGACAHGCKPEDRPKPLNV